MKPGLGWILILLALGAGVVHAELLLAVSTQQIGAGASVDSCRAGVGVTEVLGELVGTVEPPIPGSDWRILRFGDDPELPGSLCALWLELSISCEGETQTERVDLPWGQFWYVPGVVMPPAAAVAFLGLHCDAAPELTVAFETSATKGVAPHQIQCNDLSQCVLPIVARRWEFGDGSSEVGVSSSHVYERPGIYDLRLTVWTTEGDSASLLYPLHIEVGPGESPDSYHWLGTSTQQMLFCSQQSTAWDTGREDAAAHGCLAQVQDSQQQQFAHEHLLLEHADATCWLGLYYTDAAWRWSDGSLAAYTNWAPGEPAGTVDHAACMEAETGLWHAATRSVHLPHLLSCEHEAYELLAEDFNHGGALPDTWDIESQSPLRSYCWQPVSEGGGDYALQVGQQSMQFAFEEWLYTPVLDLQWWTQARLSFEHHVRAASSLHHVLYSTDGLFWNEFDLWTENYDGRSTLLLPAEACSNNLELAWCFLGALNMNTSSWRMDDCRLSALPAPPRFSDPYHGEEVWVTLQGELGANVYHPAGVLGTSLQLRIDCNGDGRYSGSEEQWVTLGRLDADSLVIRQRIELTANANTLRYEFRARSQNGSDWGYSGEAGLPGPEDDWYCSVLADLQAPYFVDPVPAGQPAPAWMHTLTPLVGVTVIDAMNPVAASSLFMRVDYNGDGFYQGVDEDWFALEGYSNAFQIVLAESLQFEQDGQYHVEFRAEDLAGNGPGFSLTHAGMEDDLLLLLDTHAPPVPGLIAGARGRHSLGIELDCITDVSFLGYQLQIGKRPQFEDADRIWDWNQDPALRSADCEATTIDGLQSNRNYWIRIRALDRAGFTSEWSSPVHSRTLPAPPAAVDDLRIELDQGVAELRWSAPDTDIYGEGPVVIGGYRVYASSDPQFVPGPQYLLQMQADTVYHDVLPTGITTRFYCVCALEGGQSITPDGGAMDLDLRH